MIAYTLCCTNTELCCLLYPLKAAAPNWEFEQINFVVGDRGSVVEGVFYIKLKKLDVEEGKKTSSSLIMKGRYAKRTIS